MSDGSSIEWTDATWQVSYGCSRKSSGCENCYAERFVHRGLAPAHRGLTVIRGGRPGWTGEVRLAPENLGIPLRWRKPRRIFVNSMSDLFHERVPFEFIAKVYAVMAAAAQHTFLVLTKRPERAVRWFKLIEDLPAGVSDGPVRRCIGLADEHVERDFHVDYPPWPLPNVHLGVSAEDQATFNERVPLLLECPAAVRWVSVEPQIGPIDMSGNGAGTILVCPNGHREGYHVDDEHHMPWCNECGDEMCGLDPLDVEDGLDWIVVGGESGPGARPFDPNWARSILAQCREAGVPAFMKQLGAKPVTPWGAPWGLRDRKGGDMSEWSEDLRVRQLPEVPRG